jgi:hypothetical protein
MIAIGMGIGFLVIAMITTIWIARSEFGGDWGRVGPCMHKDVKAHRVESDHGWIKETCCHDCGRVLDLEWGDHSDGRSGR